MNLRLKSAIFLLTLIPAVTLAKQYAVGVDLGVAHPTNIGNSTTFTVGSSTFSYDPNPTDGNALIAGLSISKLFDVAPLYTLQVGASIHSISSMNVKGSLSQGISPPYYQSTYSYSIDSYQYLVDAKLGRQFNYNFFPYLYLGLGVASNRAFDYATLVPDYLTVTPEYSSSTTNSFSYSLGLGVDYLIQSNLSIGLGYRFINLGKVGLGSGVIRNTNVGEKLSQSNLSLNTLLAQVEYFI